MVKLQFGIEPIAKGRPRFWNGRAVTPERTRKFESALRALARKEYRGKVLSGPLSCRVVFYLKRGKTVKRKYPTVGADIDNYIKSCLDALNGIVYEDDKQIIEIAASKRYGNEGMIQINFSEYND